MVFGRAEEGFFMKKDFFERNIFYHFLLCFHLFVGIFSKGQFQTGII